MHVRVHPANAEPRAGPAPWCALPDRSVRARLSRLTQELERTRGERSAELGRLLREFGQVGVCVLLRRLGCLVAPSRVQGCGWVA